MFRFLVSRIKTPVHTIRLQGRLREVGHDRNKPCFSNVEHNIGFNNHTDFIIVKASDISLEEEW